MKKSTFLSATAVVIAGMLVAAIPTAANAVPNLPPVAIADSYSTAVNASIKITWTQLKANDVDPEGQVIKPSSHTAPSHGSLDTTKFTGSLGSLVYTPTKDFIGDDTFTYSAVDTSGDVGNSAVVTIHVTNTLPTASYDYFSANQDKVLVVKPAGLLKNDVDKDGDSLITSTSAIGSGPSHGVLVMNPLLNGGFTYTPTPGFFGSDTFGYKIVDSRGGVSYNPALVTINVREALTATGFKAASVKKKHSSKIVGRFGTQKGAVVLKVKSPKGKTTTYKITTGSTGTFAKTYSKSLTKKRGTYTVTLAYTADQNHYGLRTYKTSFKVK